MIDILLATYNGEKFLAAQIDSLISQTYADWRLLVHDDGSVDGTVDVIRNYQRRFPAKIFLIEDGLRSLGAKNNFAHLMTCSSSEYVMFCDQDDIWLEGKVGETLKLMVGKEMAVGKSIPVGVFTDLRVVDENANVVAESIWKYLDVSPLLAQSINQLAVRTCLVGCTMMINRSALKVSLPIPDEAVMHDWWIGLAVLKNKGCLVALDRPTALYRQHSANAIGARPYDVLERLKGALNYSVFFDQQKKVFSMAKKAGIMGSWIHFIVIKALVLAGTLAKNK